MQFCSFRIKSINSWMNIFDNYLPMPECNKEYYSIWLENGSDDRPVSPLLYAPVSHDCKVMGYRRVERGVQRRKAAAPGTGLEGVSRVPKRSTKLLFYGINLVRFSEKSLFIDVFGTFSLSPSHGDGYTSS